MSERATAATTYSDLLRVAGFPRAIGATLLQRLGGAMLQVAIVLFVLQKFHSPVLAGFTVFLQIAPGLAVSPIAGALLDRHGRVRLMLLDYTVAALALGAIVALSATGHLAPATLLPIVTLSSFTAILSVSGARSLFPLIVPPALWDRANGLDSGLYAATTIAGPPIAAGLVAWRGGEAALLVTAVVFLGGAAILFGLREPTVQTESAGHLIRDAVDGLLYVLRNPSLRGLAASISLANLGGGALVVALPVLVLDRLHAGPAVVGQVYAMFGVAGLVSAIVVGRLNSTGRERLMLAASQAINAVAFVIMAFAGSLAIVVISALLAGSVLGLGDVALFSLRQRRTDQAWFGRAFAVSMSLNYAGSPIGSALSGPIVARSVTLTFVLAAVVSVVAGAAALVMIPKRA
jgi:MFS family permease